MKVNTVLEDMKDGGMNQMNIKRTLMLSTLMICAALLFTGCRQDKESGIRGWLSQYPCQFNIVQTVTVDSDGDGTCTFNTPNGQVSTLTSDDFPGQGMAFEEEEIYAPHNDEDGCEIYSCFTDDDNRIIFDVELEKDGFLGLKTVYRDNFAVRVRGFIESTIAEIDASDLKNAEEYADAAVNAFEAGKNMLNEYHVSTEIPSFVITFYTYLNPDVIQISVTLDADRADILEVLKAELE